MPLSYGYADSFEREPSLPVELRIHPHTNGIIVINYPGFNGDVDGFANKYGKLGNFLQRNLGAAVRTDNPRFEGVDYSQSVQDHLRAVIDYTLVHSVEISGKSPQETELYLMGNSAGAGAVSAVANEYPQVKKILLIAPAGNAGGDAITHGLGRYKGECSIIVGENDEVVGPEAGALFASLATAASIVRSAVIPKCDHQFRGDINARIMSAAPLWAFRGLEGQLPNPEDGIDLYD